MYFWNKNIFLWKNTIRTKRFFFLTKHIKCWSPIKIKQWLLRYNIEIITDKENIDSLELIKTRNLCATNDTIKNVNRHTEWEKKFASHVADERLVSRIDIKNSYNSTWKDSILKMSNNQEDIQEETL